MNELKMNNPTSKQSAARDEEQNDGTDSAQLVWKAWHQVPFDNAAMTNAVVALHRDQSIAARHDVLAALMAITDLDDGDEGFAWVHSDLFNAARAAIAKATQP